MSLRVLMLKAWLFNHVAAMICLGLWGAASARAQDIIGGTPATDAGVPSGPAAAVAVAPEPKLEIARGTRVHLDAGELASAVNAKVAPLRAGYASAGRLDAMAYELVREQLLAAEARRTGVDRDAEVRQEIERVLARAMAAKELDAIDRLPVREADIHAYYEQHRVTSYTRPERVRVSVIIMDDAMAARRVLKKAERTSAARFKALQKKHSIEPQMYLATSDAGWLYRDAANTDVAITRAAFELRRLADAASVQGSDGRHYILRLEERDATETIPLDRVRHTIASRIRHDRRTLALDQLVRKLAASDRLRMRTVGDAVKMVGVPPGNPAPKP